MITSYNSKYKNSYDILFSEAVKVLKENGKWEGESESITSLEEYFIHIGDLAELYSEKIAVSDSNQAYAEFAKFLMLPLDEELFVIDANSRKITVPASYGRNGVGVLGDQIAETLLFEVDRYFDYTDLLTTEIYVQWTNPAGKDGASRITLVDYTARQGKIIFGWPLTDKIITEGNNPLKFSVTFLSRNESDKIAYRLNTLGAQVSIKQTSFADIDEVEIDDPAKLFKDAIKNGVDSAGPEAMQPVFLDGFNLSPYTFVLENDTLEMKAQATTGDSGEISYMWTYNPKYLNEQGEVVEGEAVSATLATSYKETFDSERIGNKRYYELVDGVYTLFGGETFVEENTYYEEVSILTIPAADSEDYNEQLFANWPHVTGTYRVKAINRVGNNSNSTLTEKAVIECPETLEYSQNLAESAIYDADGSALNLRVSAEADKENAAITYKWYYSGESSDIKEEIPGETSATLTNVTELGWYQAEAFATLNRETLNKKSVECKVVGKVVAPTILGYTPEGEEDDFINVNSIAGQAITLGIQIQPYDSILKSDKIITKWYQNKVDANNVLVSEQELEYSATATSIEVTPVTESEQFYCEITNVLGEQTASVTSKYFKLY